MGRKIFLILMIAFIFTGCEKKVECIAYREVSMQEVETLMEQETDYVIVDVRTIEEFEQGHIPDAICIPNERIGEKEIPELPDKEQVIFVYCRSGNRSKQAAKKLVQLGYTNVIEFGGIIDWEGETVVEDGKIEE